MASHFHMLCRTVRRPDIFSKFMSNVATSAAPHKDVTQYSVGPSVRLLLSLYDIDAKRVPATGPHNRLLKGDILQYITKEGLEPKPVQAISQPAVAVPPPPKQVTPLPPTPQPTYTLADDAEYVDLDLSSMRKAIAKRLTKTAIPHVYASTDCIITKLSAARRSLASEGVKVSINDFIVKACAIALQRMPAVNSVHSNDAIVQLASVDVAVAVATDSGLITPIVTEANVKSVADISSDVRELAAKAREGKLQPHEFQGGSFTVSNLGMYGIKEFTGVINPPQSAILAVGCMQAALNEENIVNTMNISLSADRRLIDDSTAASFLTLIKGLLEDPYQLGL